MKLKSKKVAETGAAIDAVKDLEHATGVKVQTGLKAGAGGGKGGGGSEQPLYGAPVSSTS